MHSLLIKNADIILEKEILKNHMVYCADGKIKSIMPQDKETYLTAEDICDAKGLYIASGYIDLHIHGLMNKIADNGVDETQEISKILPKYGVTGFIPAITPKQSQREDINFLKELSQIRPEGAKILGFFMEGHFLHMTGAISHIPKNHTKEIVKALIEAVHPYKAVFGVSPEIDKIDKLIPYMTAGGAPAFITHTSANAEQTIKAIKAGASHATHFYDVFPYIGDKEAGVRGCGTVEAVMASQETSVDFILDGEHVEPIAVKMALACKGVEKVCLITDANINAGLAPGKYKGISDFDVEMSYEGGPARRLMPDAGTMGGLVGSGLTMDRAVKNAVSMLGVSLPTSVAMASSSPARVLGLHHTKGFVKEGYDADLVLLDKNMDVRGCWVEGKGCYKK